jgi:hypothetical protein
VSDCAARWGSVPTLRVIASISRQQVGPEGIPNVQVGGGRVSLATSQRTCPLTVSICPVGPYRSRCVAPGSRQEVTADERGSIVACRSSRTGDHC